VKVQQAQAQYDVAVTNLKFAAFLVVEDPSAYMDALRDAVHELEDAWNDLVDARRAGAS